VESSRSTAKKENTKGKLFGAYADIVCICFYCPVALFFRKNGNFVLNEKWAAHVCLRGLSGVTAALQMLFLCWQISRTNKTTSR